MMMFALLLLQSLNVPVASCDHPAAAGSSATAWSDLATEPNIGRVFELTTVDPAVVRLSVPFDVARGGRLATTTITVPHDGVYSVAIDRKAWIDVATGQTLETSIAHRHGGEGSGSVKIVDFRLTAGEHVLGLTGVASDRIRVLVTPVT